MLRAARVFIGLIVLLACTAATYGSPVENAKQQFVDAVARDWDTYQVCEHHSRREDRKAFYNKVLELTPGSLQQVLDWREVTVSQSASDRSLHLGIAELQFVSPAAAQSFAAVDKGSPRYLAASKILTRFVVVLNGRTALVIYSESHQDPGASKFLDTATSSEPRFWAQVPADRQARVR